MIRIGLIGFGYWGPNLARNFNQNPEFELKWICDFSKNRLKTAAEMYCNVQVTDKTEDLFSDVNLDAIAIATPVSTHYELAKQALNNDKHVWLEKPMTEIVERSEKLVDLSYNKKKVIIVDHTFIYTGAVRKIKEYVDQGELGDIVYYDSMRVNLGLFQQDVDVAWDLAAHDLAIMEYVMPLKKLAVSATGSSYYGDNITAKAVLAIYMENNVIGHINVSWVSPVKLRQTLIGGSNKMIMYDDTQPDEKLKIYDKSVTLEETREAIYNLKVQYRVGDMLVPKIENHEALSFEVTHFADCIKNNKQPETSGEVGLEIVKVLAASKKSLKLKGGPIEF